MVMGCQYNQAGMGTWVKDGFGVDTTECRINSLEGDFSVDAVYEFSRDIELKHAYFTDKYWDYHSRLEYEGKKALSGAMPRPRRPESGALVGCSEWLEGNPPCPVSSGNDGKSVAARTVMRESVAYPDYPETFWTEKT